MIKLIVMVFAIVSVGLLVAFALIDTYVMNDTEDSVTLVFISEHNAKSEQLCKQKNMEYVTYDVLTNQAVCYTKSPSKYYRYNIQ